MMGGMNERRVPCPSAVVIAVEWDVADYPSSEVRAVAAEEAGRAADALSAQGVPAVSFCPPPGAKVRVFGAVDPGAIVDLCARYAFEVGHAAVEGRPVPPGAWEALPEHRQAAFRESVRGLLTDGDRNYFAPAVVVAVLGLARALGHLPPAS